MKLVLFDIDGTLLLTGGAGGRALGETIRRYYGIRAGMGPVRPDGKTDPQIVREVLHHYGVPLREPVPAAFFEAYLSFFRSEMENTSGFRILDGVRTLIQSLQEQRHGFHLGIATGNIRQGAEIKLDRAGLRHCFAFGGYGCDAENRTELIRLAIDRGAAQVAPQTVEEVFVIGDTPQDILHGRAAGARVIAVASGNYSLPQLAGCRPDLAVASLSPHQPLFDFMTNGR